MEACIAMNFRSTSAGVRGGMIVDALGWNPAEPAAPRHLDKPRLLASTTESTEAYRQADAGTMHPRCAVKIPALLGWFSDYCTNSRALCIAE